MSETTRTTRGLSSVKNQLLPILLRTGILVVVFMILAVAFATVGITYARGIASQHSLEVPAVSPPTAPHDVVSTRTNGRFALPAQPLTAARDLVHSVGGTQLPCYPRNVKQWYLTSLGCPVTPGYRQYLLAHSRDIDPVCGCQNYALHNTFHLLFRRAGLAAVAATLTFAYDKVYIVFVEVNQGTGWAVRANYTTHS